MGEVLTMPQQLNPRRHRRHKCCPNAERHLVGFPGAYSTRGGSVAWRFRTYTTPWGHGVQQSIPVIQCPWCGVELQEGD